MTDRLESILCAAIYVDTGQSENPNSSANSPETGIVFCGFRHNDCFTPLNAWKAELQESRYARYVAIGAIYPDQLYGSRQGFLTSTGRFVDREEAMLIARSAGQTTVAKTGLISEDLY